MSRLIDQLNIWVLVGILGLVLLFALVLGALFILSLAACLFEKQRVRDFIPATPDTLPAPSPYFEAMTQAAQDLGFQPAGTFVQDRKGAMYKCYLGLWLSPDEKSLLCIGGGKIAGMNYKRTSLISKTGGDNSLVTTDEFGSEDMSGTRLVEVLMNADLGELVYLHQQRLDSSTGEPRQLDANRLLLELEEWNKIRVDYLVQDGLAKYESQDENLWRFTPKGACLNAIRSHLRGISKGQSQSERLSKKRPGS